jgi:hypothetical protein
VDYGLIRLIPGYRRGHLACAAIRCRLRFLTDRRQRFTDRARLLNLGQTVPSRGPVNLTESRKFPTGEYPMKESTLAKIIAAATAAKRTAQKALAANPNPEWTEHEMQSIDEWIARQDAKIERSEAIRRLVDLGLKAKSK